MPSNENANSSVQPGSGATSTAIDNGTVIAAINAINAHITNPSGAHPATAIHYSGGNVWADGTANPATDVDAQLSKIITNLRPTTNGASGAHRLGSASIVGAINTIAAGTTYSILQALKLASNLEYGGGSAWADGTTTPAVSIETQLDNITSWLGGSLGGTGAGKISATAAGTRVTTTVSGQIGELDTSKGGLAQTNTWTVANTFSNLINANGASGDTNAAVKTAGTPTARKLLWETASTANAKVRLYASINLGFELTTNASWNGANWAKDTTGLVAAHMLFSSNLSSTACIRLLYYSNTSNATFADTDWTGEVRVKAPTSGGIGSARVTTIDGEDGSITTPAQTYVRWLPGLGGIEGDGTGWTIGDQGKLTINTSSPNKVVFPVKLPHGANVSAIDLWILPKNTGAVRPFPPPTVPSFTFWSSDPTTGGTSNLVSQADSTGSAAAYEALHSISTGAGITISNSANRYTLAFTPESGANASAFVFLGVKFTYTLTKTTFQD